ncbi:MAG: hypothetical protein KJ737_11055 [Proteobacteria bacterium]|nr:hypothetical protein [Pseudomonadota bacterium]
MAKLTGRKRVLLVIFSLIVWAFVWACGGSSSDSGSNDNTPPSDTEDYAPTSDDFENVNNQVMSAALVTNTATVTYSSAQKDLSSTVSGVAVAGNENYKTRAFDDEKELYNNGGCPVISTKGSILSRTLTIDFQEGCKMDDISVSGIISGAWDYSTSGGLEIELGLNDFAVDDTTTDGNIILTADISDRATLAIDADLSITDADASTETFSVDNLTVVCDFNGTYIDPEDDTYTMNGTGQYKDVENNTYGITFTNVAALFLCYFPVSGTLKIASTSPSYTATIDFGSGTCDTIATVTIGKVSREIDFSEPIDLNL